jgi:cysteine desulfurase / selenocysteine lyase
MIYFDNAATSFPKPPQVAEAMARFLAEDAANPGRAGHRMAVRAEALLDSVRSKLTRLVNGSDSARMIFTLNGTDALNIALKGVLRGSGEHVVTTVLEHNSVSRPLETLARAGHIALTRVGCGGDGIIDPDDVRRAMRPNTLLIVMTHASNVLGTIQDAAAVGAIAREHDVLFCLDAAQTAGTLPIDVESMQIDLLAFPGHKALLGPTGTGALYVGERCPPAGGSGGRADAARFRPWREGGTGGDSASPMQPSVYPYFLEGGTPNTVGIVGLGAALDSLAERGIGAAIAHERRVLAAILEGLDGDARFMVYGPRATARGVGTLSINVAGLEPSDAAAILDDAFGIAVRPGLHCAPYTHRALGTFPAGTLRISPGPFTTDDDVSALLTALREIAETAV